MEIALSMSPLLERGEHVFYHSYVFLLFYLDLQQGTGCMDVDAQNGKLHMISHLPLNIVTVLSKGSSAAQGPCLPACQCSETPCPEDHQVVEKALSVFSAGSGSWMSGQLCVHGGSPEQLQHRRVCTVNNRASQRLFKTTTVSFILSWARLWCSWLGA